MKQLWGVVESWGQFRQRVYSYAHRSRKRKKLLELTVVFAILGSSRVKAARKMLVKLTPGQDEAEQDVT